MLPTRFLVPAVALTLVLELLVPGAASAREKGTVELGMDGFIGIRDYSNDHAFIVSVPISSVRAGYYVSERNVLEPSLGFNFISIGDESLTELNFDLGLLLGMEDVGRTTPYFRVGGGILLLNGDGSSDTQLSAGIAAGIRIPTGDRMAVRLQGGVDHNFEGDIPESNDFGVKAGFSFFTR